MEIINVGTRQSALALTQTRLVIDHLKLICQQHQIHYKFNLRSIVTKGDREIDVALSKVGGKGLFVKEIEQALLDGEIDFAVHSMKDMPFAMPDGLQIAAIPIREDPRDCMVIRNYTSLEQLPAGSIIGTSSLRRASQLQNLRTDCEMKPIRGNVDSRMRKLESDQYDAIVLAAAGMHRLGWKDRITSYLPLDICVPAVGQGALCIQTRRGERETRLLELLSKLQHEPTSLAVQAERSLLGKLHGGCQLPIGAYATVSDSTDASDVTKPWITLTGMVATIDGSTILKEFATGTDPELLGEQVANQLIERGADQILATLEGSTYE